MEAKAAHYQSPIVMSSQALLFSFLKYNDRAAAEQIQTLTLHLTDIDLPLLLGPGSGGSRPRTTTYDLYSREIGRLELALKTMSRLAHLTIVPPRNTASAFVSGMYLSFLKQIPEHCTELKSLTIQDSDWVYQHVPALKHIPAVRFVRNGKPADGSVPGPVAEACSTKAARSKSGRGWTQINTSGS